MRLGIWYLKIRHRTKIGKFWQGLWDTLCGQANLAEVLSRYLPTNEEKWTEDKINSDNRPLTKETVMSYSGETEFHC